MGRLDVLVDKTETLDLDSFLPQHERMKRLQGWCSLV
jgi:hypothetical protein